MWLKPKNPACVFSGTKKRIPEDGAEVQQTPYYQRLVFQGDAEWTKQPRKKRGE